MSKTLIQMLVRAPQLCPLPVELNFSSDLKLKLANSTEAELRLLQSSLRNSKDEVAADLQRNVFKKCLVLASSLPHTSYIPHSYAQFVHISKEIGILENEMLGLKDSLAEWKSMPSVLHIEESASVAGPLPHLPFLLHTELTFS
jgi:hypothetical protein